MKTIKQIAQDIEKKIIEDNMTNDTTMTVNDGSVVRVRLIHEYIAELSKDNYINGACAACNTVLDNMRDRDVDADTINMVRDIMIEVVG